MYGRRHRSNASSSSDRDERKDDFRGRKRGILEGLERSGDPRFSSHIVPKSGGSQIGTIHWAMTASLKQSGWREIFRSRDDVMRCTAVHS
jgi:hypothetical protein